MRTEFAAPIDATSTFAAEVTHALKDSTMQLMITQFFESANMPQEDAFGQPGSDDGVGEELFVLNWPDVADICGVDVPFEWPAEVIEID